MLKIAIGSDHAGFLAKEDVIKFLKKEKYTVIDVGTNSTESVDYPEFAKEVADKVISKQADFGVLICSSGEGICIAANKISGVRCGIGYNQKVSSLLRKHNDANIIAFGAKFMNSAQICRRIDIFLKSEFEGGRHQKRVNLINNLEK